jgi:hypothetical protein
VWGLVTTSAERVRLADSGRQNSQNHQDRQDSSDDGRRKDLSSSLTLNGIRAAGTAALAGLATITTLAVIGWIASPHPGLGLGGVLRTSAVLWLVGHHVAVEVHGAGRIGMLPLGLVLLPGALLWRAGRSVLRASADIGPQQAGPQQVLSAALAVAVPYSVIAGGLAIVSKSALAKASFGQAVFAGFAVAFVAAGCGAVRTLVPWEKLGAFMSARSRSILAGSAGSLALLAAAATLTTAVAIANHVHQIKAIYGLLNPGLVGAGLLLLAQLAYLPNAFVWAISYMLGPGIAVGVGTVVSPTGSVLGPVPAFPLLGALPAGPHSSDPGWLAAIMLAMPYLAGAFGGLLVVRLVPQTVVDAAAIRGFCSGAVSGIVLGVLAAFAGGPLGDGRLSAVGPSAWQVTVVATLELGISAAVTAGAASWWFGRNRLPVPGEPPVPPVRPPSQRQSPGRPGRTETSPTGPASPGHDDDGTDDGHVIFLDRWAGDHEGTEAARRRHGPSDLP